jgi:hypothetical protein
MAFGSGSGKVADHEHYEAEVNKKDLNMNSFTTTLNRRWAAGWRLDHAFEQSGNTIVVWARRDDDRPIMMHRDPSTLTSSSPTPLPPPTVTSSPAPAPPGTSASWLPDPAGRHEFRYWDGAAWTEHVSTGGAQATDQLG